MNNELKPYEIVICRNQSFDGFKSAIENEVLAKIVSLLVDPAGRSFTVEFNRGVPSFSNPWADDMTVVSFKLSEPIYFPKK